MHNVAAFAGSTTASERRPETTTRAGTSCPSGLVPFLHKELKNARSQETR